MEFETCIPFLTQRHARLEIGARDEIEIIDARRPEAHAVRPAVPLGLLVLPETRRDDIELVFAVDLGLKALQYAGITQSAAPVAVAVERFEPRPLRPVLQRGVQVSLLLRDRSMERACH
jgi:hypothetical protein